MKILILILSSPNLHNVYTLHKEVWEKYMNVNPEIECFFIEYSNTEDYSDSNILIKGNTIFVKGVESLHPGCRDKTFSCFEYFLNNTNESKKLDTYNYIIRTNMSSLWNFNALNNFLKTLPSTNLYAGPLGTFELYNITFVSGSGIIMSPDVIKLIIENKELANESNHIDDVDIAYILNKLNIRPISSRRKDIYTMNIFNEYIFDNDIYHYRIMLHDVSSRYEDISVMSKILDKILAEN